jgi:hypothetical protein
MVAGKLFADYENGEGKISLTGFFKEESNLLKADVLQDWIYFLQQEYDKACSDLLGSGDSNG